LILFFCKASLTNYCSRLVLCAFSMDAHKTPLPALLEGPQPYLKRVSSPTKSKTVPLRDSTRDADHFCKAPAKKGVTFADIGDCYVKFDPDDFQPLDLSAFARGLPRPTHWRQLALPLGALFFYYQLGFLFYYFNMSWGFIDCMYFSTVLMMTVGYGDLTPDGDLALLFTTFYAMLAFTLVATAVSKLFDWSLVVRMLDERTQQKKRVQRMLLRLHSTRSRSLSKTPVLQKVGKKVRKGLGWTVRQLLQPNAECVSLLDEDARHLRDLKCLIVAAVSLLFWIALGTIVNSSLRDLPSSENDLLKGFYFSVITLTTVGFGKLVPDTTSGKLFDIFYIMIGVPICVNSLAQFVSYIWGDDKGQSNVDIVRGLNNEKLQTMLEFQADMRKAGCGNAVDAQISRSEFLLFVLVRNEIVDMETVKEVMDNFDSLDEDGSGFLSFEDLNTPDGYEEVVIQEGTDRLFNV